LICLQASVVDAPEHEPGKPGNYADNSRHSADDAEVAQNDRHRRSAIDDRTTRHPGYGISQQKRKRIEEVLGWLKTVEGLRKAASSRS
jgi:hypothetical protein